MKSHEEQVTQLGGQMAAMQADGGVVGAVQADLELFNKRWTDTFEKLGECALYAGDQMTGSCDCC